MSSINLSSPVIILVGFFLTVLGVISSVADYNLDKKWITALIKLISIVIAIIGILFCVIGIDKAVNDIPVVQSTEVYYLVSISDNNEVAGSSFILATNSVYTFYYKEDNGYKQGKINVNNAIIFENSETEPQIIEYTETKGNRIISQRYEVYIPENSIVKDFKLDGQ